MQIDNIRLGHQSRDQLIRLKRITGIEHWNILCRWAFCVSLADKNPPPRLRTSGDVAVEMTWRTFAGDQVDIYQALLTQRTKEEAKSISRETLSEVARLHIIRGIGSLTARRQMTNVAEMLKLVA